MAWTKAYMLEINEDTDGITVFQKLEFRIDRLRRMNEVFKFIIGSAHAQLWFVIIDERIVRIFKISKLQNSLSEIIHNSLKSNSLEC